MGKPNEERRTNWYKQDLVPTLFGGERNDVDMVKLWNLISELSPRQLSLMKLLYDADGKRSALTLTEAASQLGISYESARSRRETALRRLRFPWIYRRAIVPKE